jgi:hypothetical protein
VVERIKRESSRARDNLKEISAGRYAGSTKLHRGMHQRYIEAAIPENTSGPRPGKSGFLGLEAMKIGWPDVRGPASRLTKAT